MSAEPRQVPQEGSQLMHSSGDVDDLYSVELQVLVHYDREDW